LCTPLEDEVGEDGQHRLRVRLTEGAFGNLRRHAGAHAHFDVVRGPTESIVAEEANAEPQPIRRRRAE
jgi:hypothetical protein